MTTPIIEPTQLVAGDTLTFTRGYSSYSPADGWALTYSMIADGQSESWTTSDNGDGTHLTLVTAATTANWYPGVYIWQAFVTKTVERHTVNTGSIEVLADYAVLTDGQDTRSHAKRTLDIVELAIEGSLPDAVSSYSIGSRQVSVMSGDELRAWRDYYRREYANEQRKRRVARGLSHAGVMRVRF